MTLDRLVDHIDHICQVAGSARHVGIGSDLDGAFGSEQTAADIDTIADLARIPPCCVRARLHERTSSHRARELRGVPAPRVGVSDSLRT